MTCRPATSSPIEEIDVVCLPRQFVGRQADQGGVTRRVAGPLTQRGRVWVHAASLTIQPC